MSDDMAPPGASRMVPAAAVGRATPLVRRCLPRGIAWRMQRPRALFQGWAVVAGAFLVTMVGYGAAYSFAAFAPDLEQAFGASRASVSLVYSLCGFTAFTVSAISGPMADRIGPRALSAMGMLMVGTGLVSAGAATSFAEVLLCYGLLIGIGIGFAYVPAIAAVQRWFVVRRGLASGIAACGIGVGTALVPPAAALLARIGDWRTAFVISGVLAGLVGLGGALLLARSPESRGLHPDGARAPPPAPSRDCAPVREVLRSPGFARLYGACFLISVPVGVPFAHLAAFAEAQGLPRGEALSFLSLIGLGSIGGRFALGAVADEVGRRQTFLGCCWGVAAATLWWAVSGSGLGMAVFALAFGVLYGGFVALLPAFTVDIFGRRAAGAVLGTLYTSRGLALLVGPPLVAVLAALSQTHALPLGVCACAGAAGALLMVRVRPRQG
jgi:MFS transporter, OFA family, oxalate/formate antiporter